MAGPAYPVPILAAVNYNAALTTGSFRVPIGSAIRILVAVTAVVGVPNFVARLQIITHNNRVIVAYTTGPINAPGTFTFLLPCSPELARVNITQAGGGNNISGSVDLIVQPPNSLSA